MRNGLPSNNTNNNNNRNRNRNRNNGGGGGSRPQSNSGYRPDNRGGGNNERVRGNANQLMEKYKNLARDAASAGDRVLGEYYMQHADHYFRVLAEFRSRYEENRPRDQRQEGDNQDGDNQDGNGNENRNDDQAPEGVDTVDLAAAAGFGAAAAMATFGADGPPSADVQQLPVNSDQSINTDDNGNTDGNNQNNEDEPAQPNARRSRGRGRVRKVEAEAVEE